jgi:hypothetical protein
MMDWFLRCLDCPVAMVNRVAEMGFQVLPK